MSVEAADLELPDRRARLLRAWGSNLRFKERDGLPLGELPPWNDLSRTAMRQIAAGMAVLTDRTGKFVGEDWALFSGLLKTEPREKHQAEFRRGVDIYFNQVHPYTEIGTAGPGKPLADPKDDESSGDYDFPLCDVIALIHLFVNEPEVLTNDMIRKLIFQKEVEFSQVGDKPTVKRHVPFSGQNLDEWLAAGPGGRHYFTEKFLGLPVVKVSTPETENHLLGIYAWRFLVNEYLTFVSRLKPSDPLFHRFDPQLRALVEADPERYVNRPEIFDFVLQLLGRIPHSGMYETNARPYGAIAISPIFAFYQAADRLFPTDPERQKIKIAAQNALDYLAAEFTFQSFEGKRLTPFRRNYNHRGNTDFYNSDYLPHVFGVLTGAYVFPDDENGPFHGNTADQGAGFALWALLSGYRVPRCIHDFMLNKHGGYFARIQTRYSKSSYPLDITIGPLAEPEFARPRYFQGFAADPTGYDVAGPEDFEPVTQFYFATPGYLNSAGGHNSRYYPDFKLSKSLFERLLVDGLVFGLTGFFLPGISSDKVNDLINSAIADKIHGSDINSRPSTLITPGDFRIVPQVKDPNEGPTPLEWVRASELLLPTMRGQDDFFASRNLSTYKSVSVGYTFRPGSDRHEDWPQRYPPNWDEFIAEEFSIGRATFRVFDFVAQASHPLYGHYWILARFSKSRKRGQFRDYGRGLWEVVPGYRFENAAALVARIKELNPGSHFDNNSGNHYAYRMATTGETISIHNRFGSTATEQTILAIRTPEGESVPLETHFADMRDEALLRRLPLMDVWQVDRDYQFTGRKYAYADGHGRVTVNNPFIGDHLFINSSDYRFPSRAGSSTSLTTVKLPPLANTEGQVPNISALALSGGRLYATQYYFPEPGPTPSPQAGELLALEPAGLEVLNRLPVGRSPHAIAVHEASGTVYVLNYDDHSVSIIDGASFTPIQTMVFPGSGLIKVGISQKYHRVFITQPGQDRVLVLDGGTRTQLPDLKNLQVIGPLVVDENTDRLYLSVVNAQNPKLQDVIEFELQEGGQTEVRRTTVDNQVSRAPELALDAERLFILGNNMRPNAAPGQKLMVLDRKSLALIKEISLDTGGGLGVAASGSQRLVCVTTQGALWVIDTRTWQILRKYPVEGRVKGSVGQVKGAVAVDERSGALYFGGSHSALLNGSLTPPMGT